ncbi:MAG TPA: aminotransferase class I/II-fold pyridoxal phosphate-dependent enzyme, partial [Terriglobales bacterium]
MISRREFFKGAATAAAISALPLHLRALSVEPRRQAAQPGGAIHLDSNENAYGAFPSVLVMGNPLAECNRYPYGAGDVSDAIAAKHRVHPERVLLGCGSTETLKLSVSAFTGPDRPLVMAYPSYEACEIHARATSTPVKHVPLRSDYSHDVEQMMAAAQDGGLIYICNPNNPTGTLTSRKQLEQMISKLPQNAYVLMDEAYHDFVPASADYKSFLEAPIDDPRLIVARTFSKVYGMAGLRLGYGVASPETIAKMQTQAQTDSVNTVALHCAMAALNDEPARRRAAERNGVDR